MHTSTAPSPGPQPPAHPKSSPGATPHGRCAGAAGTLPSVPVGQGETGPSYPGRYKAHRCKCREHLRLPPRFGSTHLPAGSSQSTAAGRKRQLQHPAHTTAYLPFSQPQKLSPGRLAHLPEVPKLLSSPIPSTQATSSNTERGKAGEISLPECRQQGNPHLSLGSRFLFQLTRRLW